MTDDPKDTAVDEEVLEGLSAFNVYEDLDPALRALFVPLEELELWEADPDVGDPGNPNEGDVGATAAAISEYGFDNVVVAWMGRVRAGNTRIRALSFLRADREVEFPGGPGLAVLREDPRRWFVLTLPIDHLNRAESMAFGAGDNRIRDRASTNETRLARLLGALEDSGIALAPTGYDEEDARGILRAARKAAEGPTEFPDPDPGPELDNRCPRCGYEWNG